MKIPLTSNSVGLFASLFEILNSTSQMDLGQTKSLPLPSTHEINLTNKMAEPGAGEWADDLWESEGSLHSPSRGDVG